LAVSQAVMLKRASPGVVMRPSALLAVAVSGGAAVAIGLALPVHPVIGAAVAVLVYLALLKLLRRLPPELGEVLGGMLPGGR
jgi:hypothetical protein